jgi:murein DD-endopeptidase MepM/ murein hydrolase activator NlpD
VVLGQAVGQGQALGYSGVTGFTTGEHLHFEIRSYGTPVNPAQYIDFHGY